VLYGTGRREQMFERGWGNIIMEIRKGVTTIEIATPLLNLVP
jgi:hypothetical protein